MKVLGKMVAARAKEHTTMRMGTNTWANGGTTRDMGMVS